MPQNWENTLHSWQQMLAKPKNLGLRTGTGISAAINAVKTADEHFNPAKVATYNQLETELDNLIKKCKDTKNKFKLFTDAGQLLDTISQQAARRKTELKKPVNDVLEHIKHECDEVMAKLREAGTDRQRAGQHWITFKHELENGLGDGFPKLHESINVITAMLPPNHQDSKQSITNFWSVVERMKEAAAGARLN